MKEHLRDFFPERFEDGGLGTFKDQLKKLILNQNVFRRKIVCEQRVVDIYNNSDEINLLRGALRKHGCEFNLLRHVSCESCNNCQGGYDPDTNQIVICTNGSLSRNQIMATMAHEMIHMFDVCRAKFDFNNLEHVACTEIRAANLTFCSIMDKFSFGDSGLFDLKKAHQSCVKDVASRSVKAYSPETDLEKIHAIVDKVFPTCYNDLEPFGRRFINGNKDLKQSYRERYYYGYI